MKTRIHAIAGVIGFLTIFAFWTSTVLSELFASHQTIAAVKGMILTGMFVLIPAMAIAGGSGMSMGKNRTDAQAAAKKKADAVHRRQRACHPATVGVLPRIESGGRRIRWLVLCGSGIGADCRRRKSNHDGPQYP